MVTAEEQLKIAINMLAAWCVAVEHDSSWDGWDSHYKEASYRPGPLRALLDAEMKRVRATW